MDEQTRGLLGVVAILRAVLLAWAIVVVAVDVTGTTPIDGPLAGTALTILLAWSVGFAALVNARSRLVTSLGYVIADVILAATTAALDPVAYPGSHPQSFASAWPASGAVVAGFTFGVAPGAFAGALIGCTGAASVAMVGDGGLDGRVLGAMGTVVLLAMAGGLAGLVSERLREAELTTARAQIREDIARRLHDGVLQTLAVIQRRSTDSALVEMARDQEVGLRDFISESPSPGIRVGRQPLGRRATNRSVGLTAVERATLSAHLRSELRRVERQYSIDVTVAVVAEPAALEPGAMHAITGAITEAVINAAKHSGSLSVNVFVDTDDGVLQLEVRDRGAGFDPASTVEGIGLSRSIRGRINDLGGTVEISSVPDRGTVVTMLVPVAHKRA